MCISLWDDVTRCGVVSRREMTPLQLDQWNFTYCTHRPAIIPRHGGRSSCHLTPMRLRLHQRCDKGVILLRWQPLMAYLPSRPL